ncbi:hypothetical protein GCM10007108_06730 [Thermogymnomonas acidicola]|uniref:2-phosphosulfolactate phosphatase n=1 Tax=Thermogymnomonas acidicola TaxID=399579 RepID=A0AA37F9A8_9ARCH|nr:2-phosphosulfolactate phosphatase [Thermogymnomonas acidicola]GGM71261.1 hypothetical protein GCM10007108_06730 [Thermogymnomonas acidicola]
MEVVIEDGRNQKDFEEGTRVLVDIFRSTTSIPIILHRGATRVIPTGSVSVARAMKREDPKRVLVGERFGLKVPGFDYNNSPSELMGADLQGREVIFTSTNGTKVLERIRNRGRVFLGSFVNFSKTVDAVSGGDRVFITLSNRPDGEADEDRIFGEFIREKLEGGDPDFGRYAEMVRRGRGSRRLAMMGGRMDIEVALSLDSVPVTVALSGDYLVSK